MRIPSTPAISLVLSMKMAFSNEDPSAVLWSDNGSIFFDDAEVLFNESDWDFL